MSGETIITVVGNLTADPELRYTPSGAAVADFTVASTPRVFDRESKEWKDGETLFLRCSIWREAAENVAESLRKGMRVIVQGQLTQRSYEDRDGNKRTVVEMKADEVGPSLRRATANVKRVTPNLEEPARGRSRARDEEEDERPARKSSRSSKPTFDDEADERPARKPSRSSRAVDEDDEDF